MDAVMPDHTPGPWTWQGNYLGGSDGSRILVDTTYDMDGHEADARLIAAAPDLLSAAMRALAWYEPRLAPGEEGPICNALRAAIAKAIGDD